MNLSACAYVLQGVEWYRTRDRIRLGLGGLKKFGEVWKVSRRIEKETKKIAREVFGLPRDSGSVPVQGIEQVPNFDFQVGGDLMGFEDLGGINYLAMLQSSQDAGHQIHG